LLGAERNAYATELEAYADEVAAAAVRDEALRPIDNTPVDELDNTEGLATSHDTTPHDSEQELFAPPQSGNLISHSARRSGYFSCLVAANGVIAKGYVASYLSSVGTYRSHEGLRTEVSLASSALPHLVIKYFGISKNERSIHSIMFVPAGAITKEPRCVDIPADDEEWARKLSEANKGGSPLNTMNAATQLVLDIDPAKVVFRCWLNPKRRSGRSSPALHRRLRQCTRGFRSKETSQLGIYFPSSGNLPTAYDVAISSFINKWQAQSRSPGRNLHLRVHLSGAEDHEDDQR